MIDQIIGTLLDKQHTFVVLDIHGLGYKIHVSLLTHQQLVAIGEKEKLFTVYAVRNDAHQVTDTHLLYGFKTEIERSMFEKLISVSGVGLNTARLVLSTFEVPELLEAIETENVKKICSVKGIGEKSAQRIIIDLKDKLKGMRQMFSEKNPHFSISLSKKPLYYDAILALQALGFTEKAIDQALKKTDPSIHLSTEQIIRDALKIL